jgi:hypothetical protein
MTNLTWGERERGDGDSYANGVCDGHTWAMACEENYSNIIRAFFSSSTILLGGRRPEAAYYMHMNFFLT